jgi:hypothetical protein
VFNFDKDAGTGEIRIITAAVLLENYNFDSVTYKVAPRVK